MAKIGDVKKKVAECEAKGDTKKAITELEQAVKDFPGEGSLFNKLGDLYIKVNRKDEALDVYEQGARVFKEETFFPNAIALCKKILRLDDNRTGVYCLLGELHKELDQRGEAANYFLEYADRKMKSNDLDAALQTYNIIKDLVPNNPKILETISAIYEKVGKKEEGEEFRKEAHKIESKQEKLRETVEATVKEPPVQETAREPEPPPEPEPVVEPEPPEKEDETEEEPVPEPEIVEEETISIHGESETEVEPENEPSLEDIVSPEVAELLKDDVPVVAEVEEEHAPVKEELSDVDKTVELGQLYLNLGSEDEAIDCFRNAAHEAYEKEMYAKALDLNKRIAELRPFDLKSRQYMVEIAKINKDRDLQLEAMLELAESLTRREAKSEARSIYKKILEIDPENSLAQEMVTAFEQPKDFIDLGEVLRTELEESQKPDSIQSIEGLVSQFRREVFESIGEGDFRSRYDLGVAYKGMGLFQEAIEEFEIAAKDKELKLKALEMIGSCFLERDKSDDAIKTLNEALKITDRPPQEYFGIHFLLGNCYEKKNEMREALKAYMAAFKIDKTVPELTRKINELKNKYIAETQKTGKPAPAKHPKKALKEPVKAKKSKITYL
ncbi:tetratricopeptide repeat protein [candidate division WOR-3 bacterium]|nr:tetratricopeptide repeat protein [candidate division WOR-3 bacterium]